MVNSQCFNGPSYIIMGLELLFRTERMFSLFKTTSITAASLCRAIGEAI
jgi:hypothetical protein